MHVHVTMLVSMCTTPSWGHSPSISGETQHQLALVDQDYPKIRMNDGKCDARGRLWCSTMGYEKSPGEPVSSQGTLYCYHGGTPCLILIGFVYLILKVFVITSLLWCPICTYKQPHPPPPMHTHIDQDTHVHCIVHMHVCTHMYTRSHAHRPTTPHLPPPPPPPPPFRVSKEWPGARATPRCTTSTVAQGRVPTHPHPTHTYSQFPAPRMTSCCSGWVGGCLSPTLH